MLGVNGIIIFYNNTRSITIIKSIRANYVLLKFWIKMLIQNYRQIILGTKELAKAVIANTCGRGHL
jgi:hypothetical protein